MRSVFSSLRFQLMLLVLLPAVPVAMLMVYGSISAREHAAEAARQQLVALAEFATLHLDRAVRATKQQISSVAEIPVVSRIDEPGCSAVLAALKHRTERYRDIFIVAPDGRMRCSGVPHAATPGYVGSELLRRAMANREAVVGTPVVGGPASGLPVALALRDVHGAPRGVIFALLDLNWFAKPFGDAQFGPHAVFALWDLQGRLIYHYPDTDMWVGRLPIDIPLTQAIRSSDAAGTAEVPGVDGIIRLDGFAATRVGSELAFRTSVGVGTDELYHDANRQLRDTLVGLAIVTLAALAAAWMLSEVVIRRRIGALVGTAGRLAGGDLGARATGHYGGELGQLARGLNQMAGALQTQVAALASSEARFRQTLDNMLEGCQIIGFDWRYIYLNESAAAHGRKQRDEMLGRTTMEAFPGFEHTDVFSVMQRCMHERTSWHMENRFVYGDGSHAWFDISIEPSPEGIFVVSYDITERKQAEELLREMNVELERRVVERTVQLSASNAELERFAYVASHDLQEPLRMVASYVQLLKRRYQDSLDGEAREFIDFAVDGATRMQGLINDLLQYSRVQARGNPFTPVDLKNTFADVVMDLGTGIGESGAHVTSDALPTVMGDATQLRQLLQNLVGNAIKYRGVKSPDIHLTAQRLEGSSVDRPATAPATGWLLSVRDNGIGIEPQYHERIFQLFQRLHTREEYPGTGLGLALCRRIAERHGGAIWVNSVLGEGSTFYVALPENNSGTTGAEQVLHR